ncbi:MAG: DNA-binding protein [Hyphomicrobiales bacterium]|nr:MAG: DNA-binding protein [Hyphomicrobiales bacterium]
MLTHATVWAAIDALAARNHMTPSGLARKAGLDPTTFNKSKRTANEGRQRWPSTESISKILEATNSSIEEFTAVISGVGTVEGRMGKPRWAVPLLGLAQAGKGGYFDDSGFPEGQGWDEIAFPGDDDDTAYALEVSGESMLPLYRDGDRIIVSPTAQVRRGDRVVVKTLEGEVLAKTLARITAKKIILESLNPEHDTLEFNLREIEWIVRILWASQ